MMKLYIYDHCPYCVKARMIFGFKHIPLELITLLNDDEATPIRMIGQKMVPILEKSDGSYMPESMDIVRYIDAFDTKPVLAGQTSPKLQQWLAETRDYLYSLAMPRWVKAPLEEFATADAIAYFTRKKQIMLGDFAALLAASDALIAQANDHVRQLAPLIRSEKAVNGTLSEDDIHLFAALRSLSIVKGIHYPQEVESYRQAMAAASQVPLHDDIAV